MIYFRNIIPQMTHFGHDSAVKISLIWLILYTFAHHLTLPVNGGTVTVPGDQINQPVHSLRVGKHRERFHMANDLKQFGTGTHFFIPIACLQSNLTITCSHQTINIRWTLEYGVQIAPEPPNFYRNRSYVISAPSRNWWIWHFSI